MKPEEIKMALEKQYFITKGGRNAGKIFHLEKLLVHYVEENKRLKAENFHYKNSTLVSIFEKAKSEAIKEFAERLKEDVCVLIQDHKEIFAGVSIDDIDALLKEMGVE